MLLVLALALGTADASLSTIDRRLAIDRAALSRTEAPLVRLLGHMQRLAIAPPTPDRREALQRDAVLLRLLRRSVVARAGPIRREMDGLAASRAELVVAGLLRRRGSRPARIAHLRPAGGCEDAAYRPLVDGPVLLPRVAAALGRPNGMTVVTLPGAAVVAPAVGRVAYAGTFRRYGGVVILHHGHGWTTLLTGLGSVIASANTAVGAGEALGTARSDEPLVTVELSRHGRAVHPLALLRRCPMSTPRRTAVPKGEPNAYIGGR